LAKIALSGHPAPDTGHCSRLPGKQRIGGIPSLPAANGDWGKAQTRSEQLREG
jgi:hypothetical protein